MNAVGGHIRKLRKKADMTQQTLAERLSVTRQAVSQWENGNTQPDLDTLAAIAGVFGVDMTEVIYGEKRKETAADPARRKRYVTGLIVFGALAAVMVLLTVFFEPAVKLMSSQQYTLDYLYYRYYVPPLLYLLMALSGLNLFSMFWDLRVTRRSMRRGILSFAVLLLLFHYGLGLIYLRENIDIPGLIFNYQIYLFRHDPVVFLIPGIGLFLGLNGRRTERTAE